MLPPHVLPVPPHPRQALLVRQCTTAELAALGLSAPARPSVPKSLEKLPMPQRLAAVQVSRLRRFGWG